MKPIDRPSTNRPFKVPIYVTEHSVSTPCARIHKERAEWECSAHLDVLVRLVRGERSAVTEEIDEAYSDAAIDVEDELWESMRS